MKEMNLEGVASLVKHVAVRKNRPVFVRGRFGIGKSAIIKQVVNDLDSEEAMDELLGEANKFTGCMVCDVRLSQYESVDLRGFPGVNRETGFTVWHAPATLPFVGNDEFPDDEIIILFLDELTSAAPPVAAVAYQLVNERRVGEHVLKPNVRIVAAGNREDDQGVVNRTPMPLANRFTWVEAVVDHNTWGEWAQSVGIAPVIIAFIHFKPILLMTYDKKKAEKVVATPRTWEFAADYYSDDDDMPDAIKWAAISGSIGDGPANELKAFINIWRKVTPIKDIIANPKGVPLPDAADMRYATAVSVSGAMSDKTVAPLYEFMRRMPPEMVVLAWQLACKRAPSLYNTPAFMSFTKEYRSVFDLTLSR